MNSNRESRSGNKDTTWNCCIIFLAAFWRMYFGSWDRLQHVAEMQSPCLHFLFRASRRFRWRRLVPFQSSPTLNLDNFIDIYRHIVWKIVERGGKPSNLHNSHTSWQLVSAWSEATAGSPCPSWSESRMWLRIWCLGEPWLVANSAYFCIYKNIKKTRIEYCSTTCCTVLLCSI